LARNRGLLPGTARQVRRARAGRALTPGAYAARQVSYDGGMSTAATPVTGAPPSVEQVTQALASVNDPEIHRPITELGMVKEVQVDPDGTVRIGIWLTVAGCPLRDTINRDVTAAVSRLPGVCQVRIDLDVMSDEQRRELQQRLRGASGKAEREIPFAKPGSLTKVYAIASGKGGVGKSSVTVNLAAALAAAGLKVGLLDADIYGHSVPRMLGVTARPTQVEQMIMPPSAHGVRAISSGMLKKGNEPLPLRGPILHRLLQQFLADVFWGDLDILLLDLPPGTGDVAISAAHLVPGSELIVVTTPQLASAEVAERAGALASQLHQRVVGVIETMSYLPCPHCGERVEVFGSGGGQAVADTLSRLTGTPVPLLGEIPIDTRLREAADAGVPAVVAAPDSPAAVELLRIAEQLAGRSRSLAGRQLGLTPV
jgi:ATP-binding protein involved in chromosome partitioning